MEICPHNICTGCFACVTVCPHNCITMLEDAYGELHPIIDESVCVHCGACLKTCPNNVELEFHYPMSCYASWITDIQKRMICASGGIGTIMSEYVIQRGGVVFGSRYDENLTPIMTSTESIDELEKFKGSRYVQSIVGKETFLNVKKQLKSGRIVLFIGTPCQIAGLKSFLKHDKENLITVDLICHGCTPTKYFKEEISEISIKHHLSNICDVRFRGNDGNNFCFTLWSSKKGKRRCLYKSQSYSSYYLGGFLLGVNLRENCYSCQYARKERISDITIGDFIGLGQDVPFEYPKSNVSSVTINTEKGRLFYTSVSNDKSELMNIERQYEERLQYGPSLLAPFAKHPLADKFRSAYLENGYVYASRQVLSQEVKIFKRKIQIKETCRILSYPYRMLRKMFRIMLSRLHPLTNKI